MSAMVLIPLLLTGMATGTVFASGSDVNGGGGRYTAQVDKDSMGDLQPTSPSSTSPLTTSSVSPSPVQTPSGLSNAHTDSETQLSAAGSHTVVFDPANGGKAERVSVQDGSLASPPADNPKRDGYRFDGWSEHDRIMAFSSPVTRDIALKARWTPVSDWVLSPDHGPASGGTSITITPPNAGFPLFSTLEAHDDELIGVTGDGRLFTWTSNDTMPAHLPSPRNTSGEVRFTSGVVNGNDYAALSRDHRIYTWCEKGDTPALLEADSTTYTSIAAAKDRLMAADTKGKVHIWASKGESTGKVISLPKLALAVKTAGNADRLLALDSKGQVWTWEPDAIDINQIQPIKLTSRIVQISAMDHGFVLLDATGQISYLENEKAQPESLVASDHSAITAINSDGTQAALVDSKGHVWAWKPGQAPMRADDGSRAYVQAASINGRIAAISRQGDLYGWSLDKQGQLGKPAGITTTQAPSLESASMDGQPLKLSKNNEAWRTEIPARKPGQAAILITGSQDGQPFTRSLNYTVDQPLIRENKQGTTHTVTFNAGGGSPEPADQHFSTPNSRVKRPSPDPTRQGYRFDGWFTGSIAYDFSKPVDKGLTLTAHWTPEKPNNTWSISPDNGSQLGKQQTTITPPTNDQDIRFNQISDGYDFSLAVGSDGNAYAWGYNSSGQLGDGTTTNRAAPVMVRKPASAPADFTYVQVSAGTDHSLALGSDGYVYAWGDDTDGELGNKARGSFSSVPVRVRDPASPNDTSKGLKAIQVSAGRDHSLAVDKDGNAWAWGSNGYGRLGNNRSNSYSTLPVRVRDPGDPSNSNKGLNVMQVSAGDWHSLAVDKDGSTWAWGRNDYGQLGNGQISSSWDAYPVPQKVLLDPNDASKGLKTVQVSAGGSLSLAIDQDGSTWAWGHNNSGQLGNGTSNGKNQNPIPSPVLLNPKNASTRLKAVQVSAGWGHSLAIDKDGNTWAWGDNSSGQLGNNGSSYQYYSPVKVLATKQSTNSAGPWLDATQISAGSSHSLAICKDGSARAWGNNSYTQLGNTDAGSRSLAPVPVMFNLQPAITGVKFDQTTVSILTHNKDDNSVSVTTPAHEPGQILVSVNYTLGGIVQKPVSLTYTYIPLGVLPQAGGEGVLLALATGTMSIGGMLASRRHRTERLQLLQALHE